MEGSAKSETSRTPAATFRAARVALPTGALVAAILLSLARPVSADPRPEASGAVATTPIMPFESASTSAPAEVPDVARRLWHDLLCLCGECEHKTLEACECNYAADRRQEILNAVRRLGFGTPAQDQTTYAAVSRDYLTRHSGDAARAKTRHSPLSGWMEDTVLLSSAIAGVAVLIGIAEFVRRQRSAKAEQRTTPRPIHKRRRRGAR